MFLKFILNPISQYDAQNKSKMEYFPTGNSKSAAMAAKFLGRRMKKKKNCSRHVGKPRLIRIRCECKRSHTVHVAPRSSKVNDFTYSLQIYTSRSNYNQIKRANYGGNFAATKNS